MNNQNRFFLQEHYSSPDCLLTQPMYGSSPKRKKGKSEHTIDFQRVTEGAISSQRKIPLAH